MGYGYVDAWEWRDSLTTWICIRHTPPISVELLVNRSKQPDDTPHKCTFFRIEDRIIWENDINLYTRYNKSDLTMRSHHLDTCSISPLNCWSRGLRKQWHISKLFQWRITMWKRVTSWNSQRMFMTFANWRLQMNKARRFSLYLGRCWKKDCLL